MLRNVMALINAALTACSSWFVQIFNASGVVSVFFAFMSVYLAIRFLLAPVFGSAGSDRARKSKEVDSDG